MFEGLFILLIAFISFAVISKSKSFDNLRKDGHIYSELFMMLSIGFLGIGVYNLTRNFGRFLTWEDILLLMIILSTILSIGYNLISTFVFAVIGIPIWWIYTVAQRSNSLYIATEPLSVIYSVIGIYSLLLYVLSYIISDNKKYQMHNYFLKVVGLVVTITLLFLISSEMGLRMIASYSQLGYVLTDPIYLFSFVTVLVSLLTALTISIFKNKNLKPSEIYTSVISLSVFCFISLIKSPDLFVNSSGLYSSQLNSLGFVYMLGFNAVLVSLIISVVISGYERSNKEMINIGLASLFIFIIFKYFDWFFSFLDKSLFFIGAGVVLFVVGFFLETSRRKFINKIENE